MGRTRKSLDSAESQSFYSTSPNHTRKRQKECGKLDVIRRQFYEYEHYFISYMLEKAPDGVPHSPVIDYEILVAEAYSDYSHDDRFKDITVNHELIESERWTDEFAKEYLATTFLHKRRLFDEELRKFIPRGYEYLYILRKIRKEILWPDVFARSQDQDHGIPDQHIDNPFRKCGAETPRHNLVMPTSTVTFDTEGTGLDCDVRDCKGRFSEDHYQPHENRSTFSTNILVPVLPESPNPKDLCVSCRVSSYKNFYGDRHNDKSILRNVCCNTLIFAPHFSGKTSAVADLRHRGYAAFETNNQADVLKYPELVSGGILFTSTLDTIARVRYKTAILILPDRQTYNDRRDLRLRFNPGVNIASYDYTFDACQQLRSRARLIYSNKYMRQLLNVSS